MHEPIIRSYPDQSLVKQRRGDAEYSGIELFQPPTRLFSLIVSCQVRADCPPALALIGRFKQHVCASIYSIGLVLGNHYGVRPLKTVLHLSCCAPQGGIRPHGYVADFLCTVVVAGHDAPKLTGIDNIWISGIRGNVTAFATANRIPVGDINSRTG